MESTTKVTSLFLMLFQRVGGATKSQTFILDGIVRLLKEELCFTAWKLNYRKNIPETNAVLRHIGREFDSSIFCVEIYF